MSVNLASNVMSFERGEDIGDIAMEAFGKLPNRVAFPGGVSRDALVVDMDDGMFIFTKREDSDTAKLEALVLSELSDHGNVPRLQGVYGRWVIQEFIEGDRLPIVLDEATSDSQREQIVAEALHSLVEIHNLAAKKKIARNFPRAGVAKGWLLERASFAQDISEVAGIAAPDLNRTLIARGMDVQRNEFIKWDARPGNAIVGQSGTVWFDWEEAARSKALDDLAFVLCDEWTNLSPEAEARLIEQYFPFFNRSMSETRGRYYFHLFAVTHCLLRLYSALRSYHKEGDWIDRQYLLERDKVGATKPEVTRLIERIYRFGCLVEVWKPLIGWLPGLADRYELNPIYRKF